MPWSITRSSGIISRLVWSENLQRETSIRLCFPQRRQTVVASACVHGIYAQGPQRQEQRTLSTKQKHVDFNF